MNTDSSSRIVTFASICIAVVVSGITICLYLTENPVSTPLSQSLAMVTHVAANETKSDDKKTEDFPPAEDLIKDWEKPDVALFVSGRQHGYIEPCGCTGLENQKGGLMRRHSVMKILQRRGWNIIPIDAGNQIRRYGDQPLIKLQHTFEALCKRMKYQNIGLGPDDLKLAPIDIAQIMLNLAGDSNENPFTCANVVLLGADSMTNRFRIINLNGRRVGVTSIIGNEHLEPLKTNEDLTVQTAEEALPPIINAMKDQRCDLMVLTAHANLDDCRALAKKFPVFNLLVTAGGAGDPTDLPERIQSGNHTTNMIQVGVKGMYVGVVGLYTKDGKSEIKYKRVPLDARFSDSPEMIEIFKQYQAELKLRYETGDNGDIQARLHESGAKFMGSESCQECHDEEYDIWADGHDEDHGPHFGATESLTNPKERGFVARNFDPECLSCHVTGWNPQNYYPYQTGYADLKKDEHLHGNGCENCHGPGSVHIELEQDGDDEQAMEVWRKKMQLTVEQAKKTHCRSCHDLDNSPAFQEDDAWEKYWPRIKH